MTIEAINKIYQKPLLALPEKSSIKIDPNNREQVYLFARELNFKQKMNGNIDVGQGCIFAGRPHQVLESDGFSSCAPFIMLTGENNKMVLGHIDARTRPDEIVDMVKKYFAPKEIENASYHYFRGSSENKKHSDFAVDTIKEALEMLGVKGNYEGVLGDYDKVVVQKGRFSIIDETESYHDIQNFLASRVRI